MRNADKTPSPRGSSRQEEVPDPGPSTGHVVAVQRAIQLLEAFALGESQLSLADISRRCDLHKTTALRILRTLAACNYVVSCDEGAWRLGPAAGWLGARYQSGFDVQDVVEPMLRKLSKATRESAAFYVREGDIRTCLMRVEGVQPLRHHARMGEGLPLDKGSPGRVILAFSGERGAVYERIRQRGYCMSIGEREKGVATVSAPVFGARWKLLGSVCISGPAARLTEEVLEVHAKAVINAANALSYALAGSVSPSTPTVVSTWHPPS